MNLVVNARDALPHGGHVRISTADLGVDPGWSDVIDAPAGAYVALSVEDDGIGMDEQTLSRAFEPFFTTKGPSAGTGLGLSTVYGIVKQSGGDVRVESSPGRGTRFDILLPHHAGTSAGTSEGVPAAGARGVAPPAASTRQERVLVVEDNALVRATTCRTLESAGYRVMQAASAEEALRDGARDGPLDLVLTDVGLPGLDGRELVEQLRAERPGLKALLVSGHTGDTKVDPAEFGGAFLQKPYAPAVLLAAVRDLLDRGEPRAA
jgi:CheY-like chemotaxis protein